MNGFTIARKTHPHVVALVAGKLQRGVTLVEFSIVLLVLTIFVTGIYSKGASINDEARLYRATDEIMLLLAKSSAYKSNNDNYEDISISQLNTDGYSTDPVESGTGNNPWGLAYTLSSANTDANLKLTVVTSSGSTCSRLRQTLDKLINNSITAPACAGTNDASLSVTVP
jgi:prepilin-type N-terminal cleavage/methylation domain-containing protein